ncbi:MAG TPA: hypothetical protein ENJ18_08765 [Nannocystis exedens]|nr:hypothetical protein [Nannocystis exedens]
MLDAVKDLASRDLAMLTLWVLASDGHEPEYARVLAITAAQEKTSAAMACRLWLMHHAWRDLGVATTLLGALETEAVTCGCWPKALGGSLAEFLRHSLDHPEPSVRAGVLSCLALAGPPGILRTSFTAPVARSLAEKLDARLRSIADDEEVEDLAGVKSKLEEVPENSVPALQPRALTRVVLDLLDARDKYDGELSGLDDLVTFTRRRVLLDDAGQRALKIMRPIQTFRVLADEAATRVVQAIVNFGEAVVGVERRPDYNDLSAPDFGTAMAWAPAASVPMHLLFQGNEARKAFTVLEAIIAAEGKPKPVRDALAQLDPAVAEALLRLITRLRQHEGNVEIVLTDPGSPEWQRTVSIGPEVLGKQTIASLMGKTRERSRRRGVVVYKDHVPQANTVEQVFQAVDAMLDKGVVSVTDIKGINNKRQVNYYRQGARILGLFDDDNQPTSRAKALIGLHYKNRLALTAIFFEDSPIGRAWRVWAGVDRLVDVDPSTAREFLQTCVVGLSGTTPKRRASTLKRWLKELTPHYPSNED